MTVKYRAFYPGVTAQDVLLASEKQFPLRDDPFTAAEDARNHWHREGEHTIPYEISEDGTVTELMARVKRRVEVLR